MQGTFTGKAHLNMKEDDKVKYYVEGTSKNGNDYRRFNLSVTDGSNNKIYLELFGTQQDEIKTMDSDNNKITVSWDDRDDKAIINKVASYKKNVFTFVDDERVEFISPYDAVEYLKDHADELNDTAVGITASCDVNVYKGKISNRYTIKNIYKIDDNKNQMLRIVEDFFFNKNSLDMSEWKSDKKITLNGYIQAYISEKKENMYIPQTIILDCSKLNLDKKEHMDLMKFRLAMLNCEYKDGKITTKLKSNTMYKIGVELRYINSAQEVEFDESMLSETQKLAIKVGAKTLEDFAKANRIFGERVIELKILNFNIERDEYSDGCVDLELKPSEFEDDIFTPDEDESEDILDGAMNAPEDDDEDSSIEDDPDTLFG